MSGNSQRTLSEYFANAGPSLFDELAAGQNSQMEKENKDMEAESLNRNEDSSITGKDETVNNHVASDMDDNMENIRSNTFTGQFQCSDFIKLIHEDKNLQIPDEVRDHWEKRKIIYNNVALRTKPTIMIDKELPDLIAEVVEKHLGSEELSHRKIADISDVKEDESGLYSLINVGSYRAAANLTARILTRLGQGYGAVYSEKPAVHTKRSLHIWFIRFAVLIKLGEYELLQKEAEPFHQLRRHDVFYQHDPDRCPGRTGSMASFSFRLLLAELPSYCGNPRAASNRLSELLLICGQIKDYYRKSDIGKTDINYDFWAKRELRVLYEIVNCTLLWRKFNLMDSFIHKIIFETKMVDDEERRTAYSAWGRIYLQIGDIFGAEQRFASSRRLRANLGQGDNDVRDLVDKGLVLIATNDFPEAYSTFQKALHMESGNTMILNNMGVSLLYAGKLKDAINLYERALTLVPHKALNENCVVNLCALYELELSNPRSRKLNLLRLLNRHRASFRMNLEICLKLQTTTMTTTIASSTPTTPTTLVTTTTAASLTNSSPENNSNNVNTKTTNTTTTTNTTLTTSSTSTTTPTFITDGSMQI